MENKHFFYVLHCNDGSFYGGYTTDPKRRVKEHNSGTGAKYTRIHAKRPVRMIHLEAFQTRQEATKAEARFKKLGRKQKESYLKNTVPVYCIRRFNPEDNTAVSLLLQRNFLEINSQDYSFEKMTALAESYTPEKITKQAAEGHMYVAEIGETIIGTITLSSYHASLTECILLSLFVLPEYHQKGIGHALMSCLKADPIYVRSTRMEAAASRTAKDFYIKQGFKVKNEAQPEDSSGYIRMEKYLK